MNDLISYFILKCVLSTLRERVRTVAKVARDGGGNGCGRLRSRRVNRWGLSTSTYTQIYLGMQQREPSVSLETEGRRRSERKEHEVQEGSKY